MANYVTPVNQFLKSIDVQPYDRYLPNAFNDSLTMLEKVNKVIYELNQSNQLTNEVIKNWNDFVRLMNEGNLLDGKINEKMSDEKLIQLMDDYLIADFKNEIQTALSLELKTKATKEEVRLKNQKITQTDISEELLQQMAGDTPINAIPADRSITKEKIALKSVGIEETSFIKVGKNLFNKNTVTKKSFVNYGTGNLGTHDTYTSSDFIPVESDMDYFFRDIILQHYAIFDVNKNVIRIENGGLNVQNGNTIHIHTTNNTRFIRVTVMENLLESAQLEKGNVFTGYETYGYDSGDYSKLSVTQKAQVENIAKTLPISIDKIDRFLPGKNLFNKETSTPGKYVNIPNGELRDHAEYNSSDFILIEPDTDYSFNAFRTLAWYNNQKSTIVGIRSEDLGSNLKTARSPSNARYVRMSIHKDRMNDFQFEKGVQPTTYEAFGYKLENLILPTNETVNTKDEFLLFLPSEICIAVGVTIELYNKQVSWCGNIDNYHFQWKCTIGKAMKRKWSCKAVAEKIGNHTLTCVVFDNNMKQIQSATTNIKIVSNVVNDPIKVLPIGDSLTNNKPWMSEIKSLSSDKISFVGTRWNGDVQGGNLNHEGRSGASSKWYLTDSKYDFENNGVGSNNPFYNPEMKKFDFNYYKNTYKINPNIIQIYLGTNGISINPTDNVNNIKAIVDGIRESDSTIKIFVVFPLYRGDQNGIGNQLSSDGYSAGNGIWKLDEDRKVYNLMVALYDSLKTYSNLFFTPVALTHDSEFNFRGTTGLPVNPRSTITEFRDVEATHPSPRPDGYLQMADIMFSNFVAHQE